MYIFKDFNFFKNKYVAEIQLPGNGIRLLSIPQSSIMIGIGDFHHTMKSQIQLQLTVACS
jgi:hypothetical protein